MRKAMIVMLVVASILGAVTAAHAGKGKGWVAEAPYGNTAGVCVDGGGHDACGYYIDCGQQIGCARVILKKTAASVDIEIVDTTGTAVRGRVYAPGAGLIGTICGGTTEPLFINGAAELWVHVTSGTCEDSSPSTATTGIVRVKPAR
jgi:hypothetical protein